MFNFRNILWPSGRFLDRFLRGNFSWKCWGWRGQTFLGKKKRFLRGNFPEKFPRPKFPQEILARIPPAEKILKPKNSWRQEEILRGNLSGSLDNRTEISTLPQYWMMLTTYTQLVFSAVRTHASSHTNVAPRALTNVRGSTAVLAGMILTFFVFSPGSSRRGCLMIPEPDMQ